ncbi:MAG: hypothetical protein EXR71_14965 [Myxococcales bacterium]|nr:hypothetical protein [Myxococcales bacterium]
MATSVAYFNLDGSRGQECRLALAAAGVPFEDIRLERPEWVSLKPSTPFGAMPILNEVEPVNVFSASAEAGCHAVATAHHGDVIGPLDRPLTPGSRGQRRAGSESV